MRKIPICGLTAVLMAVLPLRVWAGPKVHVGAKVGSAAQVSIEQIDHRAWDTLLRKYCDDKGFVNYQAWKNSAADMQALDQYLALLSSANSSRSASANHKFAFWINAYNAVTVKGILREYPTTSIRNHTAKVVGYNIWHDLLINVGGQDFSLDQIEHKVLRPMGDPRIHFAIVCASIGCPPLLHRAYNAEELGGQLDYSAKQFFANPQNFSVTGSGDIRLSQIMNWFPKDFGPNQAAVLKRIAPYLPTPQAQALARSGRAQVSYLEYDWGLNDQAALRNSTANR